MTMVTVHRIAEEGRRLAAHGFAWECIVGVGIEPEVLVASPAVEM